MSIFDPWQEVLDKTKYQGLFGMNQISPWMFWIIKNITKYRGHFGMDQISWRHFEDNQRVKTSWVWTKCLADVLHRTKCLLTHKIQSGYDRGYYLGWTFPTENGYEICVIFRNACLKEVQRHQQRKHMGDCDCRENEITTKWISPYHSIFLKLTYQLL